MYYIPSLETGVPIHFSAVLNLVFLLVCKGMLVVTGGQDHPSNIILLLYDVVCMPKSFLNFSLLTLSLRGNTFRHTAEVIMSTARRIRFRDPEVL